MRSPRATEKFPVLGLFSWYNTQQIEKGVEVQERLPEER